MSSALHTGVTFTPAGSRDGVAVSQWTCWARTFWPKDLCVCPEAPVTLRCAGVRPRGCDNSSPEIRTHIGYFSLGPEGGVHSLSSGPYTVLVFFVICGVFYVGVFLCLLFFSSNFRNEGGYMVKTPVKGKVWKSSVLEKLRG